MNKRLSILLTAAVLTLAQGAAAQGAPTSSVLDAPRG